MSKCCGTCARSRTNNVDGTVCSKSGKPVSYLAVYDCWTDQAEPDPAPLTKVCQRCGRELPIDHFGRHVRTKDGYQPLCRECLREANTGKRKRQPWKTPEEVEAEKARPKEPKTRGRKVSHPDKVVDGVTLHWCGCCKQYKPVEEFSKDSSNKSGLATQCKACRTKNEHERRVRKRAKKNAAEVVAEAAAAVAAKVAHEYVEAQPKVDAPAGGIVFPKTLEKTVPKVVVKRELKITKSVTVEAYLTEIGRDEEGRKGYFHFACFASELDKLTLVWNKSPLTVTLSFNEIVEE